MALSYSHQKTPPFLKELASSDRRTRDKALESLTLFLRARRDLSLLELLKVWKGLFFCFYHSDRPLTQQALARALSYSLVPTLPRETLHRFLRAFWITIGRDFHSLDRLRLDKYLFLIRCYVGVAFEVFLKSLRHDTGFKDDNKKRKSVDEKDSGQRKKPMKAKAQQKGSMQQTLGAGSTQDNDRNEEQDAEADESGTWSDLEAYVSILEDGPLCPVNFVPDNKSNGKDEHMSKISTIDEEHGSIRMPHGPDGLRYHIMDIWLDELEKVIGPLLDNDDDLAQAPARNDDMPIDILLRPMRKLKAESPTKTVRVRAGDVLEDERLVRWGFVQIRSGEDASDEEEEWDGIAD
ncbi:hypothetical protein Egran_06740 [Elaphomyces granulatus]|uniref:Ribosomal RNA-processing protein 1 n=1 Tax=Elaphomyces granulatus TaxID=519963 RepID=A0A232LNU5_9EURO|nr:hypothetical protein Egran_06740 [Elaphomyces granulatus]